MYRIETTGEVEGFVTVIEENGEVRSVIGISNESMLRNPEIDSQFALIMLLGALVASVLLVREGRIQ